MLLPLTVSLNSSLFSFKRTLFSCHFRPFVLQKFQILFFMSQNLSSASWKLYLLCNPSLALLFNLLTHLKHNSSHLYIYFIYKNMNCQFQETYSIISIALGSIIKSGYSKCLRLK